MCRTSSSSGNRRSHDHKGFVLVLFPNSETSEAGPNLAPYRLFYCLASLPPSPGCPLTACHFLCYFSWAPRSHWSSWLLGCHPKHPELSEDSRQSRVRVTRLGTVVVRCHPSCTVSCRASLGLPSALRDDMLGLGPHVPLHPGAIIDRHIGFATEEGP